MPKRSGRKSLSQTKAPKSDRIYGSKVNPKGSASSEKSASAIKLDAKTIASLSEKLKEFKSKHPSKDNVTLNDLKAVYRRGLGAYSSSHRPTISGGKPNTRNAWAMARVNKFLLKASGGEVKKAYVQDDDLLKMHLGGDMSKHLAPNGKPSNLTHEQWHLVRTPEFKAWFGDWEKAYKTKNYIGVSKVINSNGEPLLVWHTTNADFNIFNIKKSKNGFFFAPNKDRLYAYGKSKIFPFFLNIKNPYSDDKNYLINDVTKKGYDGIMDYGEAMKSMGNLFNEWLYEIIAFYPEQIKLADGTNTTFDGSNPDIRYADGGGINDCFEFIQENESILHNGYHLDLNQLSNIIDPYSQIPMGLDFTLITYNSGGQNNLDVINTITPIECVNALYDFLNIDKSHLYALVNYYIDNAKRITDINQIQTKNVVIIDRDRIVCENLHQNDGGGEVDKMIEDGVVELKMYATTNDHSKKYGFDAQKPLYIQSIIVSEEHRGKGIGTDVMKYIVDYATTNGHDVIFGHITQKAEPSVDVIKSMLMKSGFKTIEGNNDFYKLMNEYANGGEITNACIEEVVNIINSIQKVKDFYIYDGKLIIVLEDELMVYSVEMMNYHLQQFTECHDIIEPEVNLNYGENYKSIFLNLKVDDATIGQFKDGGEVNMHLGGDMSKHLAPNGKPSNLTHEQWHLVRTPEFKAWFGDWEKDPENASKVVDENGEPKVMWHGSDEINNINVFKSNKGFDYNFFATDIWEAMRYTSNEDLVKPFFINAKKLLNTEKLNDKEKIDVISLLSDKSLIGFFIDKIYQNQKMTIDVYKDELGYGDDSFEDFMFKLLKFGGDNWILLEHPIFQKYIISNKYDGFTTNEGDGGNIAIYDSNNIKLADGTNTTFDGGNPDIRYEGGGVTDIYTGKEIKKAYVSIRIREKTKEKAPFTYERIIDTIDPKPFEELSNGVLNGVLGVSTSSYNVSEWLVHRECLVVMPFDEFLNLNDAEQVKYFDAYYLTKNGLEPFFRLYDRKQSDDNAYYSILQNMFPKISNEFGLEATSGVNGDLYYTIGEIFNVYNSSKFIRYVSEQPRIQSPEMFAQIVCDYINSGKIKDDYYRYNEFSDVQPEDIIKPLIQGIVSSGKIYRDESEWILKNKTLVIPKGSQLFFVNPTYKNFKEENEKLIDEYGLRDLYKINYVNQSDLNRFQQQRWKRKDENFKKELDAFKGGVEKKISNALVDIENEILNEFERNLWREVEQDEYMHPEYFKDFDGNKYGTYMEIPEVVNFYNNFVYKLSQLIEEAIPKVVKEKNKYYLSNVDLQVLGYIDLLEDENRYKEFEFMDEYGTKFSYYDLIYKMTRAFKQIDMLRYADSIKNRVGGDLYRAFSKDELMFRQGGETDKYEISDYWDTETFGGGGEVKTKKIITDKIGWSEEVADYLINLSPKLAIWFADSLMKDYIDFHKRVDAVQEGKELLKEMTARTFRTSHGSDIRLILDWLQHPLTEKQNLRQLNWLEAVDKAKQFHDELKAIGGDVDYVEPEENTILIRYPKDANEVEYYWVEIPKQFCSLESKRMGHCGRTGSGDSLISLRSIRPYGKGHTINDSHVTIAYDGKNAIFYQTKGKQNAKPSEKYFPYIFDLIKTLAKEDRYSRIADIESQQDKLFAERNALIDLSEALMQDVDDLKSQNFKLDNMLMKVKNNRDYEEIMGRMAEIKYEIEGLEDKRWNNVSLRQDIDKKLELGDDLIAEIREKYQYGFGGFGSEYSSKADYGWDDMTKEQIEELYKINPELFKGFGGELILYTKGLSDKKPNTKFTLSRDLDYLEDFFFFDRNIDPRYIQKIISGEEWGSNSYRRDNKEILKYWLDDLDSKSVEIIEEKISEITGLPKEEVHEDGIEYYLNEDYNEEYDKDFDFDDIFDRINRSIISAEDSAYIDFRYKEIKEELAKIGQVIELDETNVVWVVDILDHLSMNQLSQLSKQYDSDDLAYIFTEGLEQDEIEKPRFRLYDSPSISVDSEVLNEYFHSDDFYEKGGKVRSKRLGDSTYEYKGYFVKKWDGGQDSFWNIWRDEYATDEVAIGFRTKKDAMDWLDEYSHTIRKSDDDYYSDGGTTDDNNETYKKWRSLVNMSASELKRFYDSQEGKDAGLSSSEAKAQGIDSGRESARWILKMKATPKSEWTPQMWKWAKKQISFISRMSGNKGGLYDDKGRKTRKHTSLLIWGHNPEKKNNGGKIDDGQENFGKPPISYNRIEFIHETNSDDAQKIIKNGFRPSSNEKVTKGIYTIPSVWKYEKFNPNHVELVLNLKPSSNIFWTNSKRPSDYYMGYGNEFYEKLYSQLTNGKKFTIGSKEQGEFCRKMESWLMENGYCGVQQGGEIVITDNNCIESIDLID